MSRLIFSLVACSPFVACAPTSEGGTSTADQPFVFSSFSEPTFAVTVVGQDGMPLVGVSVSVEDVYQPARTDDSAQAHHVYLRGLTDTNGVLAGSARLPNTTSQVDVVVHDDAGRLGPWTDATLRVAHGFHAPSSRQTLPVGNGNVRLVVTLQEESL